MDRCRDLSDSFYESVYNHLHDTLLRYKDFNLLLLLDQLIRQFKYFKKLAREDCDKLFMNVFNECYKDKNNKAIRELKIVWRVWTYIFGDRIKNIKVNILNKYKCNIDQLTS
jgi:hypothetical protein